MECLSQLGNDKLFVDKEALFISDDEVKTEHRLSNPSRENSTQNG